MSLKEQLEAAEIELELIQENIDRIEMFVEGDENVGDYVSETNSIESIEELKEILRVLEITDWNWGNRELSEDDEEVIRSYVPYGSNEDIHTITDISITLYTKSGERYKIYHYCPVLIRTFSTG